MTENFVSGLTCLLCALLVIVVTNSVKWVPRYRTKCLFLSESIQHNERGYPIQTLAMTQNSVEAYLRGQ